MQSNLGLLFPAPAPNRDLIAIVDRDGYRRGVMLADIRAALARRGFVVVEASPLEFPRDPAPARYTSLPSEIEEAASPSLRDQLEGSVSLAKIEASMAATITTIREEMATWAGDEAKLCLPALMDAIHLHEARLMAYRHTATRKIAQVHGLGQWRPDPAGDEDDDSGD